MRKHPPAEDPEADDLDDHRQRLDDEEAPDDEQQELRFICRHRAARPEPMASDPVSPMKIRAGAAFHHRKPRHAPASATDARRQVQGRRHVVDAIVAELPVADHGQAGEAEGGRARGEPVEAVGEVHGVGRPHQDHHGPDDPADLAQVDPQGVPPGERQMGVHPGPVLRQQGEGDGDDDLGGRTWPACSAPGCGGGGP